MLTILCCIELQMINSTNTTNLYYYYYYYFKNEKVKVKQSRYRPGVARRVPGS